MPVATPESIDVDLEQRVEQLEQAIRELCRLLTSVEPRAITKPLYEPGVLGRAASEGGADKPALAAILEAT
jgi:hypothetical protein